MNKSDLDNLSDREIKEYLDELEKEIKLRRYSSETLKTYRSVLKKFLKSDKSSKEFLLSYSDKSRSTMRIAYFALKFFYDKVLDEKFDEGMPLAKREMKIPVVLNKGEIEKLIDATVNLKHKLLLYIMLGCV